VKRRSRRSGGEIFYKPPEHLEPTIEDVINNPHRKMGHAFVLIMLLKGMIPIFRDGGRP